MNFRKLSLSVAAIAAFSPALSHANPEDHALKACVSAFTASLSPAVAPAIKLNYTPSGSSPLNDYYAHEFTFTLHALDAKTRSPLATASCSATQQGTVLAMRTTPAPVDAKLASR